MKKSLFVSIVCAVCAAACAFGLAACGGHDHEFAEKYSYNSEYHWRQCLHCNERLDYSKHSSADGLVCDVCGYEFNQGTIDDGDGAFGSVTVSANGVLSWNKIKGASKYVLKVTFASESDQTEYDIDGNQTSANLNELRSGGFPAGKSSVEIVAYENAQVTIGGQTEYQEVPMTDVKQSFRIVKSNGSFSLVRLSYSDDNIKLDGFYAEKQTISDRSVYLYEQALKNNQPMTLKINDIVKAASGHTVQFYKSEAGRNSGDTADIWNSFELQMGYPQVQHGANFYYVKVTDNATGDTRDYDLCVYGIYSVTIQRFNTSFYESYDGLRTYTHTPIGNDLIFNEMDIVPQEALYGGVGEGAIGRSESYEILQKQDITLVSDSTEIKYYFYDEDAVRSDCREYEQWSQTYYLNEMSDGWSIACKQSATGIVKLPDIIIGKKVISATYSYCGLSALIVEDGAQTLTATFTACWDLLNIFLPETITEMRKNSFAGVNTEVTVNCAFSSEKANGFTLYWNDGESKSVKTEYGVAMPDNALTIERGLVFAATDNDTEVSVAAALGDFDGAIPATVTVGDKTYNVTRIDALGNVQSLTIGESIKEIANGALSNVQNVTVASSSRYFTVDDNIVYNKDRTRLLSVANKNSQTTSLTIDGQVKSIDIGALAGLSGLQSLTVQFVGASATDTRNNYFGYIFGGRDYSDNESCVPATLRSVVVAGGDTIGERAFMNCGGITDITILDGVTSIDLFAFYSCDGLTSITLPSSVKSIGESAFMYCRSLASIIIPDGVTSIGSGAFSNCSVLSNIVVPDSVIAIGYDAFANTAWYNDRPNGLVYAGKVVYAYKGGMPNGTEIVLEEGTKGIADWAFNHCDRLVSIVLPDSLVSIGIAAFDGCGGLTSITIPYGVTSIDVSAFQGCNNLTDITFNGTKAQWNAVKGIGDGDPWAYGGDYTIHCTDGDIVNNN